VFALLYGHPDRTYHLRQIVRLTGSGQGAVQRELGLLTEAGIITRERVGNLAVFQANRRCPVFPELRSLTMKTAGLGDVLRHALEPLGTMIRAAFVYGSFADGRDTAASDVDVMIIGDIPFGRVVGAFLSAQDTLGREINPTVFPTEEFRRKAKEGTGFVGRVMNGNKIFLVGDEDELARVAREPLGDGTPDR
jgi:DNA-binding transcriptional ArsR family regulator